MAYYDQQSGIYPTEMLDKYSQTVGNQPGMTPDPAVTMPVERNTPPAQFDAISATRPAMVNQEQDFTPVVGWLVGVSGSCRGKDFPIRAGYNYIGRGMDNDICIPGDMHISGDRHAMVAYSPKGNTFTFAPVNGRGIVSVNEEDVFIPVKLKMRDIIEIGNSKLYFIPLCDEEFDWVKF